MAVLVSPLKAQDVRIGHSIGPAGTSRAAQVGQAPNPRSPRPSTHAPTSNLNGLIGHSVFRQHPVAATAHVTRHSGSPTLPQLTPQTATAPPVDAPWWQAEIVTPFMGLPQAPTLSLTEALQRAAGQSPEIGLLQADVDQRRAELLGEQAAFDWSVFADSTFDRDNVPVGSSLDGANNRLRDRRWDLQTGFRNLNSSGGQFSIYQDFGFRRSNSSFLTPPTQGTGRITAEYTHPLLQRSGEHYNLGRSVMAGFRRDESAARLVAGTEDHLLRVTQSYWDLVFARGEVAITKHAWSRTSQVVDFMNRRRDVDVGRTQLLQAQSAKATRETDWTEARYNASRAQERLLRLIYGDAFQQQSGVEVITTSIPSTSNMPGLTSPDDLHSHPRIIAAREAVQASTVDLDLSLSDLEPRLDLVLSAYSAGLRGKGKFLDASQDAWTDSEPGFGVGLNFEYPLGNRRAKAEVDRKHAQLRRLQKQFQLAVADVALNIRDREIAVEKASAILSQSEKALEIAKQELKQLETRRELLVDGSNIADLYLDTLLRSQERLSAAERRLLFAQVELEVSLANQQHAHGQLRARVGGHPVCHIDGYDIVAATARNFRIRERQCCGSQRSSFSRIQQHIDVPDCMVQQSGRQ